MLVLTRQVDQEIVIGAGAEEVIVRVTRIDGDRVRLAVTAPREVPVHRREIAERVAAGERDRRRAAEAAP